MVKIRKEVLVVCLRVLRQHLSVRNEEKQQQQKNKVEMGVILAKI
jgi:hypothetical protein